MNQKREQRCCSNLLRGTGFRLRELAWWAGLLLFTFLDAASTLNLCSNTCRNFCCCFATNVPTLTCILAIACFLFLERRSLYALISQMRAPAHAAPPADGVGGVRITAVRVTATNSKMYLLSKTPRSE